MKPLEEDFYRVPSEEEKDAELEKERKKSGLKWKRVEFAFAENKLKQGGYQICSIQIGQSRKYELRRNCSGVWTSQGPPSGATWEYCKDESGQEYIRLARFGTPLCKEVKIPKK